jgi:AraC family transcriptional regulator, transcriptional activator FtrA
MSVATEIFGLQRPELGFQPYELIVCAENRSVTMRDSLFTLQVNNTLNDALGADTIIVPNRPDPLVQQQPSVLELIKQANRKRKRLIGFCTGAFTLADAGVLQQRKVTLHWRWSTEFQNRFPNTEVIPDVLYVEDRNILTSAGSSSALDLCLHVVRQDFGAEVANSVSRRLVYPLHRNGGQQQFVETTLPPLAADAIGNMMQSVRKCVAAPHSVRTMASSASLAPSTFHRRFLAQVGTPPATWLLRERVQHARRLLETTDLTMEQVSAASGLGTAANLRMHFHRHVGTTPTAYRRSHN